MHSRRGRQLAIGSCSGPGRQALNSSLACIHVQITALFLAAQKGHGEIAKLLVNNGASPVQPSFIQVCRCADRPRPRCSTSVHSKAR